MLVKILFEKKESKRETETEIKLIFLINEIKKIKSRLNQVFTWLLNNPGAYFSIHDRLAKCHDLIIIFFSLVMAECLISSKSHILNNSK